MLATSREESMGEKGSACSACLQQVGRTFVLPQYSGFVGVILGLLGLY